MQLQQQLDNIIIEQIKALDSSVSVNRAIELYQERKRIESLIESQHFAERALGVARPRSVWGRIFQNEKRFLYG